MVEQSISCVDEMQESEMLELPVYFHGRHGPFKMRKVNANTREFCGYSITKTQCNAWNYLAVPRGTDDVCYTAQNMKALVAEIEVGYANLWNAVAEILDESKTETQG